MLLIAVTKAFVLLTGYFSLIFVLLLFLLLMFKSDTKGDKGYISFFGFSFFTAFIFAGMIYCRYYDGFLSGRGQEALDKLGINGLIENIILSSTNLVHIFDKFLFYNTTVIILIIIGVILFLRDRKLTFLNDNSKLKLYIIAVSFAWSFGIIFLAPFKILRYVAPAFPLMLIIIPLTFSFIQNRKIQFSLMFSVSIVYLIMAFSINHIDFLEKGTQKKQYYNQYSEIPVVVMNKTPWKYADLIPYFADKQSYEFSQSKKLITDKINNYNKVFVILEEDTVKLPSNYKVINKFVFGVYFTGYLLEKR